MILSGEAKGFPTVPQTDTKSQQEAVVMDPGS